MADTDGCLNAARLAGWKDKSEKTVLPAPRQKGAHMGLREWTHFSSRSISI